MPVYFEGFPRVVEREAMKPGRWFVAAEGARPLICFSTEEGGEGGERLILTFGTTRPETLDFAPTHAEEPDRAAGDARARGGVRARASPAIRRS